MYMRRSICITEPDIAYAGQKNAWRFVLITSSNIPAKSLVRFDPLSQGKEGDWQLPQTGTKSKGNSIFMVLPDGKSVSGKEVKSDSGFVQYEFLLPHAVNQGEKLTFEVGSGNKEDGEKGGNISQSYIQRRRPFHLYIDTKGKGDFKEPEVFTIDVKGNFLSNIRIIAPSVVYKNSRFDVVVRFEDKHGNLTGNAPENTLIELSYDQLRENLNWKLFVPETGFLTLPNLYFNEPGLYRLRLKIANTNTEFISSPMYCFPEEADHLFWGMLRGESERYDSLINIESALRNFRDDHALQFFATSSAEEEELTSSDNWKTISNMVAEFNEEERFVTMLGFQWPGEDKTEGCHQFIYPKDNKPVLRKKDQKYNGLKKIYKSHSPKEFLSIPYLTMAKGLSYNFDNFSPDFERVVEIYNSFGSSECSAKNGNIRPIKSESKKGVSETEEGSIRKALNRGCRFGFVAGGKDLRGSNKEFNVEGQAQYSPGTTAILTKEYSRDSIFLALYNRRCFATTGARILVFFNIAGKPLGSELDTKTKPGLSFNRYIHGFIAGTAPLKEVVIFRNGVPLVTYTDRESYFEFEHDDSEPIDKVVLKSEIDDKIFAYYYIRATQEDGHIAWSSPIWVDYFADDKKGRLKK
jgi:hypothetical protein